MRTVLIALTVAIATWPLPAVGATRNFGVCGFDRIRVDGPYKVRLATGVAPFATASGSPHALDGVAVEVQGRTLIVHSSRSSWGGYPGQDNGSIEIEIGTHELTAAWLNGAGTLQIDKVDGLSFDVSVQGSGALGIAEADVDQLRVSLVGAASAKLTGRASKMTAMVRGISSLDAGQLVAKDATIGAQGPATIAANVTNAASIDGSGVATITLSGNPACTTKLVGSSSVSGCRAPGSGY
jgi:hypothetical protein